MNQSEITPGMIAVGKHRKIKIRVTRVKPQDIFSFSGIIIEAYDPFDVPCLKLGYTSNRWSIASFTFIDPKNNKSIFNDDDSRFLLAELFKLYHYILPKLKGKEYEDVCVKLESLNKWKESKMSKTDILRNL